uniref:Capsid protein n=1 Tax=Circovirus sp. TaxID=1964372 RepID=A0A7G5XAU8_9CIRC|nr:capsid protein [Circovirus sp.]
MPRSYRHRWRRNRWFKFIRRRRRGHTRGRRRYRSKQGIFNFRLRNNAFITIDENNNQGFFSFTLKNAVPEAMTRMFDMYRINKVRAQFLPMGKITDLRIWGASIIDLTGRDTSLPNKGTIDFTIDDYTRRLWNPTRLHSRYFTPKPEIAIRQSGEAIQPNSRRHQLWLDTRNSDVKQHGLAYYFDSNSLKGLTLKFNYTVTYYMQFRQFVGNAAPVS